VSTLDREHPTNTPERLRVTITGAVQGVGFRPFVYRLATALDLRGWVINDTRGVFIEVEGDRAVQETFLARLATEAPPVAHITGMTHAWLDLAGFTHFEIRHSDGAGERRVIVLPDLATCPDCLADLFDPANRRYRYPFTNCTNCGPRFTIVEVLPYDRPNTTMRAFPLCPACHTEYTDPRNRRFHAQPNACPVCGPQVAFYTRGGERRETSQFTIHNSQSKLESQLDSPSPPLALRWPATYGAWSLACVEDAAMHAAAAAIRRGEIVAVKGLGGFHLMADARNADAVQRLRDRKARPAKPLAVMVRDLAQAAALCEISAPAAELLTNAAAPIVLLPRRAAAPIAAAVAPDNPDLGVMLAATPLHHLLLAELGFPIVATSGNLTDEPICTDEWEAFDRLGAIADSFLIHDRPLARHADDSVLWLVEDAPQLLRRARGYAPLPVRAPQPLPTILGVGAHLKNTVALSIAEQVLLSQHIGDLETAPALAAFERVIADFLRLYAAAPVAIAHDLHPEYLSTKWAVEQWSRGDREKGRQGDRETRRDGDERTGSVPISNLQSLNLLIPQSPTPSLIPVQHHHAHLAACLADNGATGPALGLIWDGTGYGLDGTIWGGECLLGDAVGFTRVAHLRPFRLPGGEAAVRQPRRVALALLWEVYGDAIFEWDWLAPVRSFAGHERRLLAAMLAKGVNAPRTTSMGRLFDGVAALIGLHQQVNFEGQAAMALEHVAAAAEATAYATRITETPSTPETAPEPSPLAPRPAPLLLDWAPLLDGILADLRRGENAALIAARFHNALVALGVAVAQRVGHAQVALSGGCFQNRRLTATLADRLRGDGFDVLLHRQVPPNDGGVSLGQVMIATEAIRRRGD
jgi:hydrogenase maturation protein HypF